MCRALNVRSRAELGFRHPLATVALLVAIAVCAAGCTPTAATPRRPPVGTYALVVNATSGDMRFFDMRSLAMYREPIELDGFPLEVAVDPGGRRAYVISSLSNSMQVIDTWAHHVVGDPIRVGDYPSAVVVSPTGDRVYVASGQSNDVRAYDTRTLD